jgi:hypothetical protein
VKLEADRSKGEYWAECVSVKVCLCVDIKTGVCVYECVVYASSTHTHARTHAIDVHTHTLMESSHTHTQVHSPAPTVAFSSCASHTQSATVPLVSPHTTRDRFMVESVVVV